jgi:CubicO group peptidase (beta-lactamase class C family)
MKSLLTVAVVSLFTLIAVLGCTEDPISVRLIAALNTKDATKLKAFIEANFDKGMPAEDRAKRLMPIVDQGAPFKLVKIVNSTPTLERVLIEDREGQKLGLSIELDLGHPPKITHLRLGDPESLDAPPPKDYSGWKDLASLTSAIRKDTDCPALGVAVWQDGKPIEIAVDGVRELGKDVKVNADDVWHLGSIGKSITSTLIGRLIDLGKLRWEMTLKEAFPAITMNPGYEKVTLEQVMHHRGGIPQDMGFRGDQVDAIVGQETDPVKIREKYARNILGREPIAKPGERFAYSNAGYALLGHLAETVMGKPYEVLVKEMVFEPLGMKSAVAGKADLPAKRPIGHMPGPNGLKSFEYDGPLPVLIRPAGDLSCSLADLAKFAKMHMEGLRGTDGLLKSVTVKRLHEALPEAPGGPGYACGWSVGPLPGTASRHGHNGSNGTFRAEMAFFPDSGLIVVAITNRGGEAEPSPPLQAVMAVAQRYAPSK